jgi:hypothetical protein
MNLHIIRLSLAVLGIVMTPMFVFAAKDATHFKFHESTISGVANGGSIRLTGHGEYALPDVEHAKGDFRCVTSVNNGPLNGCAAGEGRHWDAAALLTSTGFKCLGPDSLKTATSNDHTVVLRADFFREHDGKDKSFTASMIVSDVDIAPDVPGIQNVWIQGVGCGSADVRFK